MKVLCVLGSPRKNGNSEIIAGTFCEAAKKKGAEVTTFALNKMSCQGCQACMVCKTKKKYCVLQDDLTPVLEAAHDADVLVAATPVYFADVSGQFKLFVDRAFSWLVPDFHSNPDSSRLAPGKKLVFIITQGQPNEQLFEDVHQRYQMIFNLMGFKESHLIRACGVNHPGDVNIRKNILDMAVQTAEELIQ